MNRKKIAKTKPEYLWAAVWVHDGEVMWSVFPRPSRDTLVAELSSRPHRKVWLDQGLVKAVRLATPAKAKKKGAKK